MWKLFIIFFLRNFKKISLPSYKFYPKKGSFLKRRPLEIIISGGRPKAIKELKTASGLGEPKTDSKQKGF